MSELARSGNAMPRVLNDVIASRAGVRLSPIVDLADALHGVEVTVYSLQERNQGFAFRLAQAGQQAALAFECNRNYLVVGRRALRGERDRIGAPILAVHLNSDQAAVFHRRQRAAYRTFVKPDYLTDARGRNFRLDRQQRQDAPLGDAHGKEFLVEYGRAARQLVGDEGDKRRNIPIEIEDQFDLRVLARLRRSRIARLSGLAHSLPRIPKPSDIETPSTAPQEQTSGGPQ